MDPFPQKMPVYCIPRTRGGAGRGPESAWPGGLGAPGPVAGDPTRMRANSFLLSHCQQNCTAVIAQARRSRPSTRSAKVLTPVRMASSPGPDTLLSPSRTPQTPHAGVPQRLHPLQHNGCAPDGGRQENIAPPTTENRAATRPTEPCRRRRSGSPGRRCN